MESKCVVCHEKTANHRCLQCHKPTCNSCAFKNELGVFCGRECGARYREYKQNAGSESSKGMGGLLVKIVILVLIIAAAWYAWSSGILPWGPAAEEGAGGGTGAGADTPVETAE
jgi:hypothetical protein